MTSVIMTSLPIFLGAILAFLFGLVLYSLQKKSENGLYLSYTISILTAQISSLYSFKKQIAVSRKEEIENLERELSNIGKRHTELLIRRISEYITNGKNFDLPVNLEKLSFLADFNPNILVLLSTCKNAGKDTDQLIETCNLEISNARAGSLELQDIHMLIQMNKQLLEQIDYALNLTEHLQQLLVSFSKIEFKNYVTIKSIKLDDSYKTLQPVKKTSWHEIEYLQKRSCLKNVLRRLRRLFQC